MDTTTRKPIISPDAPTYGAPEETIEQIRNWVERAVPPGDFLRAVLSNDLKGAFAHADQKNTDGMAAIMTYLHNNVPAASYGSPDAMKEWARSCKIVNEGGASITDVLGEVCQSFRKGSNLTVNGEPATETQRVAFVIDPTSLKGVVEINNMPPVDQASPDLKMIDCHYLVVGVDQEKAKRMWPDFAKWLLQYMPRMREVSYIELGAIVGDQELAFQVMALGEVMELWQVLTPEVMGIDEPLAIALADQGFITISGFQMAT